MSPINILKKKTLNEILNLRGIACRLFFQMQPFIFWTVGWLPTNFGPFSRGKASLTWCQSLDFNDIRREPQNQVGSLSPAEHLFVLLTFQIPYLIFKFNYQTIIKIKHNKAMVGKICPNVNWLLPAPHFPSTTTVSTCERLGYM